MVYTLQAFKSSKSHLREVSTSLATPTQVNQLAHGLIIYTVPMLWWGIGYNSLQTIFYQGCIIAPKPFSILLVTWIRDTDLTLHFMFALLSTTHWWERIPATQNVFLHTHTGGSRSVFIRILSDIGIDCYYFPHQLESTISSGTSILTSVIRNCILM